MSVVFGASGAMHFFGRAAIPQDRIREEADQAKRQWQERKKEEKRKGMREPWKTMMWGVGGGVGSVGDPPKDGGTQKGQSPSHLSNRRAWLALDTWRRRTPRAVSPSIPRSSRSGSPRCVPRGPSRRGPVPREADARGGRRRRRGGGRQPAPPPDPPPAGASPPPRPAPFPGPEPPSAGRNARRPRFMGYTQLEETVPEVVRGGGACRTT